MGPGPSWADTIAWVSLAACCASALAVVADEALPARRQHMAVMNVVHPITALYLGPAWLWAYVARGRSSSRRSMHDDAARLAGDGADPQRLRAEGRATAGGALRPWHVAAAVSHCGAGCTLGDIGGEWIVWAAGAPALGASGVLGSELVADFALAWTLGVAFQYLTIVPMRPDLAGWKGVWAAVRADTLSILSFQVGLFGWMALSHLVLWQPPLRIDTAAHWWMMQVGMGLGFLTAWPVNRWLVAHGWKEKMGRRMHLADLVEEMRERRGGPALSADGPDRGLPVG